jgi:hypothetical protein
MLIIEILLKLIISVLLWKNATIKFSEIVQYYITISSYYNIKKELIGKLWSTFLLTSEFIIAFGIYFFIISKYIIIFGIILQINYLYKMLTNYGKEIPGNCGCYILNMPKKINFKPILFNTVIIYIYIILLLLLLI